MPSKWITGLSFKRFSEACFFVFYSFTILGKALLTLPSDPFPWTARFSI
jgi:hypothetical protein